MTWNHFVVVGRGGGGEKGSGGGDAGVVVLGGESGRVVRVLGRVMAEMSSEVARGRDEGSCSASSGVGSAEGVSRSRAKRSGEALRACWAASGVR